MRVKSCYGGLFISFMFYVFAMFYMHYDSGLFWCAPLEYFATHDFPYMFIVSFQFSLLGLFVPTCAALSAQVDQSNVSGRPKDAYRSWAVSIVTGLLPLLLAFFFFVIISLCVMPRTGTTLWQTIGMRGAYGWRISNEWFWVYVVECCGRLSLSVIIWVTVAQTFSIYVRNKIFVVLGVTAVGQLLNWFLTRARLSHWDLRSLQIPDVANTVPLSSLLGKQLVYLLLAVCTWQTVMLLSRAKRKRTSIRDASNPISQAAEHRYVYRSVKVAQNENIYVVKSKAILLGFITSVTIPIIYVAVFASNITSLPAVGDHLIFVFGGFPWGTPDIDVNNVVLWIMLYIPTLCGLAFFTKEHMELPKGLSPMLSLKYVLAQQVFFIIYTVSCVAVMWISIACHALLKGADFSSLSAPLIEGYGMSQTAVIIFLFLTFSLQSLFWSQIFLFALKTTRSPRFSAIVYTLAPFIMILLGSNEDKLSNTWLITNWGMVFRSALFSAQFIKETISDGTNKIFQLCTFSPHFALSRQATCVLGIAVANLLFVWQPLSRFRAAKRGIKRINETL